LVKAFKEKKTGITLNVDQISALTDIVKACTLVSNQKLCEGKHYNFFNQPEKWWDYRANILGYSKESLKEIFIKTFENKKSGEVCIFFQSSSSLDSKEMTDAIQRFRIYASKHGLYLPEPNEYDYLIDIQNEIEKYKEYL